MSYNSAAFFGTSGSPGGGVVLHVVFAEVLLDLRRRKTLVHLSAEHLLLIGRKVTIALAPTCHKSHHHSGEYDHAAFHLRNRPHWVLHTPATSRRWPP